MTVVYKNKNNIIENYTTWVERYNNTTKLSIQYRVNLQRLSSAIDNFCTTTISLLKIIGKKTRYQSMSELNIEPPAQLQTENGF